MTHSLGALVLLLVMPSFAQTAPDLSDATPAQSPPAPTNTPALGLSIGTKFMSGEPDRAENDCLVHWRGDWGLESDVEQLFMRDIWTYLGGVQVVETGHCLCEKRFPSWSVAMEYLNANYAGLDRVDMDRIRLEYVAKSRNQAKLADEMCKDGYR